MIAPLRRRHRRVVSVLAVLVPAIYFVSLSSRAEPELRSDVAGLRGETPRATRYGMTPELDLSGSVQGMIVPAQELPPAPELSYSETFDEFEQDVLEWCDVKVVLPSGIEPDTYVYWSASFDPDEMPLPAGARLIGGPLDYGEAANYSFRLAPKDRLGPGYLLLFSVAHGRIVASEKVEPVRITGGGIY